jgi:hypothetical protein
VGPCRQNSILLTEERVLRDLELLLIIFKRQGGTRGICATLQEIQGMNGGCTNLSPTPFLLIISIKKKHLPTDTFPKYNTGYVVCFFSYGYGFKSFVNKLWILLHILLVGTQLFACHFTILVEEEGPI